MKRYLLVFCWAASMVGGVSAQESRDAAELRFVQELRARGYNDLARDYLQRLSKNASPELTLELPFELAKATMGAAGDEPDAGKRLALYEQSRTAFLEFLKANPNHPRASEVKLEVARVASLLGKTQLSRALAQDGTEAKTAELLKAREKFLDAGRQLEQVLTELDAAYEKVGDATAADAAKRKRLANERLQARLTIALNLFDQAQTYPENGSIELGQERGKKLQNAQKLLEQLAAGDDQLRLTYQAQAWVARCMIELGVPKKARPKLDALSNNTTPAAADGRRLARYFRLLVLREVQEQDEQKDSKYLSIIVNEGNAWLSAYPGFLRTPEGYGMRYLIAEALSARARIAKTAQQKQFDLNAARTQLREVESGENDYTDRARRLKIAVFRDLGLLTKDYKELSRFDEFYARAQYEGMLIGEETNPKEGPPPDAAKREQIRKTHTDKIIAALQLGLTREDAKPNKDGKVSAEVNNAKAMLVFYNLSAGNLREAVKLGEDFVAKDPRSSQAGMAAVYALQAYGRLIAKPAADAGPEAVTADREAMLKLAREMEQRWPKELPGDVARHQLALSLLSEHKQAKDPAEAVKLLGEALDKLAAVGKDYSSYNLVLYQTAEACLQAERDKIETPPGKATYHQRAVAALRAVPEPAAGVDATNAQIYVMAKRNLALELFKEKKFQEMYDLTAGVLKRIDTLPIEPDALQQFKGGLLGLTLYATAGLAEADFLKSNFEGVVKRLDPIVVAANGGGSEGVLAELKKNPQLGTALLSLDLRANVQLGRLDRVDDVLKVLVELSAEGGSDDAKQKVLQILAGLIRQQIEALQAKGDKENLEKATAGFVKILDKVAEKPAALSLTSRMTLALCYSNMGDHKKAASLLQDPPPAPKDDKEKQGLQMLMAKELRLAKDTAPARQLMNEMLGTREKPGWGARNLTVLLEEIALLEEEGKYGAAATKANKLVEQLLKDVNRDNALKERYFEAYYHCVYCLVEFGKQQKEATKKAAAFSKAANQMTSLEKSWPNFGSDASAKRFNQLLAEESEFKSYFESAKAKN